MFTARKATEFITLIFFNKWNTETLTHAIPKTYLYGMCDITRSDNVLVTGPNDGRMNGWIQSPCTMFLHSKNYYTYQANDSYIPHKKL